MPRVPTYDNFQVAPNNTSTTPIHAPDAPNYFGQQVQQLGESAQKAGATVADIQTDMLAQANQLRVDEALNQMKEAALTLTYDKDSGYTNLKGKMALDRPDGKPLADEYGDKLKKQMDDAMASLGNEAQKSAFMRHANDIMTSFKGSVTGHEAQEFRNYGLSVAEGIQATAMRDIGLNYDKPEVVNKAVQRIQAEVYRQAGLLGKSAEWQEAQARNMTSRAHRIAIESALQAGNPVYAAKYIEQYKGQMDADDILSVNGHITKEVDNKLGAGIASEVIRQHQRDIDPPNAERAFKILLQAESGGQHFEKDGKTPKTSTAGAIGIAQIMPSTGPEAAKLAGVKWDESRFRNDPSYNEALGRAYFQHHLQLNGGDPAQTYAAYNAGQKWVDKAVNRAKQAMPGTKESDWFWQLNNDERTPKNRQQTQAYVTNNMKAYESGQGVSRPTIEDLYKKLEANPLLANNPNRLKIAKEELERQFDMQNKAIKQREEEGWVKVQQEILSNGGNFSGISQSSRAFLMNNPKHYDDAMGFAKKIRTGDDTTDLFTYQKLTDNNYLKSLNDAQFFAFRKVLSEADFKHFSNERAKILGRQPSDKTGDLNSQAITETLNSRLKMIGMDPSPKEKDKESVMRIGAIRKYFDDYFYHIQKESGKKLSDAEVAKHIDEAFAKNAVVKGWFTDTSQPIFTIRESDIPKDYVRKIKADLSAAGISNPTSGQMLNRYYLLRMAEK